MPKEINSEAVKNSLLDYKKMADELNENGEDKAKKMIEESIKKQYESILLDEDENQKQEDEEDTDLNDTEPNEDEIETGSESEDEDPDFDVDGGEEDSDDDEGTSDDENSDDDEWADFDNYKVSDNEYDMTNAKDDEIVKAYKLMDNDEEFGVVKDGDEIKLSDDGKEYIIVLDDDSKNKSNINNKGMKEESRTYELELDEYDAHLGYKPNLTQPMSVGSNFDQGDGREIDLGLPKGKKRISKIGNGMPFTNKIEPKLEEEFVLEMEEDPESEDLGGSPEIEEEDDFSQEEEPMGEATNVGGFVQQNSTSKSHIPNSKGRRARNSRFSTEEPRYSIYDSAVQNESIRRKASKILAEDKKLKGMLDKFKSTLNEAQVTNMNLGQIIRIICENATTMDEKKEIIKRFGEEANTTKDSKRLYESISNELKHKKTATINESKQYTTKGSKEINEKQIYASKELMESLDMMHKICD